MDFNDWLDGDEATRVREANRVDGISVPSKALYAGDRRAYEEAFRRYRKGRRHEVLNERYFSERFDDSHWFVRNLWRFDQLVEQLVAGDVVPFIGAGMSKAGGFPTWEEHLRTQGRTGGIDTGRVEDLLSRGEYETVISDIEARRGRDVFVQEARDVFSGSGTITDATLLITEVFVDTVITTNYDGLIEQGFDAGGGNDYQVIGPADALADPNAERVAIVKVHGDIRTPGRCILSKDQYDEAYGVGEVDVARPIPKLLEYYYRNGSLLFLGCSLKEDRTARVFRAVRQGVEAKYGDMVMPQHFAVEQAPEGEEALVGRNAYLLGLGVTGIWFEKGQFEYVEAMLRLARDELRYRGVGPRVVGAAETALGSRRASGGMSAWVGGFCRRLFGGVRLGSR